VIPCACSWCTNEANGVKHNAAFSLSSRQIHVTFPDPLIQADLAPSHDRREGSAADERYTELHFAIISESLALSLST